MAHVFKKSTIFAVSSMADMGDRHNLEAHFRYSDLVNLDTSLRLTQHIDNQNVEYASLECIRAYAIYIQAEQYFLICYQGESKPCKEDRDDVGSASHFLSC